jgi:hypothetical protein
MRFSSAELKLWLRSRQAARLSLLSHRVTEALASESFEERRDKCDRDRVTRAGGSSENYERSSLVENNENKENQMRRFKLLGLALMAVFVAAAGVVGTASAALPKVLPETGTERTWTGTNSGNVELKGATNLTCTEAPTTGTQETNKPLGAFHMEIKNCTAEKGAIKCTGLGDAAGVILLLGTWHSVFDNLATLSAAILYLFEKLHYNCSSLVLVLLSGELVCLSLKPTESAATHTHHCVVTSGGVQEDTHYFNEAGTEVPAGPTCSINEAAKEETCTVLSLVSQTFLGAISMDI